MKIQEIQIKASDIVAKPTEELEYKTKAELLKDEPNDVEEILKENEIVQEKKVD